MKQSKVFYSMSTPYSNETAEIIGSFLSVSFNKPKSICCVAKFSCFNKTWLQIREISIILSSRTRSKRTLWKQPINVLSRAR